MLTAETFRARIPTALEEQVLEGLLTAAYDDIAAITGGETGLRELLGPGRSVLVLSHPAASIVAVRERDVELAEDDYDRISPTLIRRVATGTHPSTCWGGSVIDIAYQVALTEAQKDRVAVALVQLDIANQPGLASQRLGDWAESYVTAVGAYADERRAILDSLFDDGEGAFV